MNEIFTFKNVYRYQNIKAFFNFITGKHDISLYKTHAYVY